MSLDLKRAMASSLKRIIAMKLQHKTAGLMILTGSLALLLVTVISMRINSTNILQEKYESLKAFAKELSSRMDSRLKANIAITKTLASTPLLSDSLTASNLEYSSINPEERNKIISELNFKWMHTENTADPFIQKYLDNPAADFLKLQQVTLPGVYGEIFLTNKYGVVTASTGKLTTLAHKEKYWWESSYFNGKGRIFLDDRGFDTSAEGYVLGVVIPVKKDGEIIGILKSNLNLKGLLEYILMKNQGFGVNAKIQIVRAKGLIVAEKGLIPLSSSIPDELIEHLKSERSGISEITENGSSYLTAFAPVSITSGSDEYGFGGSYESIDHIKGNEGEEWFIVVSLDKKEALKEVRKTGNLLIITGLIIIMLMSLSALLLGRWFVKPIVKLSEKTKLIGTGKLDIRTNIRTSDEIGALSESIDSMVENLSRILTSRDKLRKEVKRREKAEKEIIRQLEEKETILKEVHHRIKNNFASIEGILAIQADSASSTEAVSSIQKAISRVHSIYQLYEKLLVTEEYTYTSVKHYLEDLVDDIAELFLKGNMIAIEKDIDPIKLDPKLMFPLGLIVNELITNSMKYAFKGIDNGRISVTLKAGKEFAVLIIEDNGTGPPKDFTPEASDGFGLTLVRMLSKQLKGSFSMDTEKGTKSRIVFKI